MGKEMIRNIIHRVFTVIEFAAVFAMAAILIFSGIMS